MGEARDMLIDVIARYLMKSGSTKESLAFQMGMSTQTLRNKLTGVTQFTLSDVDKVCLITGKEPSQIFDGRHS